MFAYCKVNMSSLPICSSDAHTSNHPHHVVSLAALSLSSSNKPLDDNEQDGDEPTIVCPSHAGSQLKYYCAHCDTAVCEACTTVSAFVSFSFSSFLLHLLFPLFLLMVLFTQKVASTHF